MTIFQRRFTETRNWLDSPDMLAELDGATRDPLLHKVARDLIVDGLAVIRGAVAPALCAQVIEDYHRWVAENSRYRDENLDAHGRERRLVNFHHWSDAELQVVTNSLVMRCLDFVFGAKTSVYTSLTFKYGTQQPLHRDTPHFATWPARRFVGFWTALEDIDPNAGPLMFSRGGHRYAIDQLQIFRDVRAHHPEMDRQAQLDHALDLYNGRVMNESEAHGPIVLVEPLQRGDVVIWHPELPHGGSPAVNPALSRWSVVAHCAPDIVQVHQHDRFFGHEGPQAPEPRYGFRDAYGRKIAVAGEVAYM